MENLRPESYNVINDNTRAILIEFYENGMLSTKEINKIKEAAARTGLDLEKIKVFLLKFYNCSFIIAIEL